MAKLRSNGFVLEMALRWNDNEGVVYDLTFTWQGIPIINDEVIKRANDWWGQAKPSSFFFTEYARLRPVQFFREMLDAVKSDFLEPVDPDIRIIIHPIHAFPEDRLEVLWEADHIKKEREERERMKEELGKLPDDLFKIEFFLNISNFKECGAYSGDGITFTFLVDRAELESFVHQLETERENIVREFADNPEGNGLADKDDQ